MRLRLNKSLFLFCVSLFSFQLFCQEKIEIERPIDKDMVPKPAIEFIQKYFPDSKVKWILEINKGDNTYEAKLAFRQKKLSIEFFKNGDFLDAELTIDIEEIDSSVLNKIEVSLSNEFTKYKIQKIQRQYTGEGKEAIKLLKKSSNLQNGFAKINYEIIVWGKSKKENAFFEYLFDNAGDLIKSQKLSPINSDNLFY